jgi:transcriptional regulator with XRE-family HTH domain
MVAAKTTEWTPQKIKQLRGQRTQAELGKILRVPKNTVWRWEAGYSRPDAERSRRLARIARKQEFVQDWTVAGSAVLLGDLEEGSRHLAQHFKVSPGKLTANLE